MAPPVGVLAVLLGKMAAMAPFPGRRRIAFKASLYPCPARGNSFAAMLAARRRHQAVCSFMVAASNLPSTICGMTSNDLSMACSISS